MGIARKAGTAWSNSFLHLKSWHPLSYRNQEKLFKAEQAERDRKKRDEAAAKEFAEQAEFFKNTELLSAKDREGLRNKQQLAFMYQKPPGFNAMLERQKQEAAEAAERTAEEKRLAEETEARVAAGLPLSRRRRSNGVREGRCERTRADETYSARRRRPRWRVRPRARRRRERRGQTAREAAASCAVLAMRRIRTHERR